LWQCKDLQTPGKQDYLGWLRENIVDEVPKWLHNRGLHLKKYEGSAQMEAT